MECQKRSDDSDYIATHAHPIGSYVVVSLTCCCIYAYAKLQCMCTQARECEDVFCPLGRPCCEALVYRTCLLTFSHGSASISWLYLNHAHRYLSKAVLQYNQSLMRTNVWSFPHATSSISAPSSSLTISGTVISCW